MPLYPPSGGGVDTDDQIATEVPSTPSGNIAATTVQAAIVELDTEKASTGSVTTAVSAHEAAADPHTGYQKESEKAAANGYASLGADTIVPTAQLGSGAASGTTFLRGDKTWATPAGGSGGPATVKLTSDLAPYLLTALTNATGLSFAVTSGVYYNFSFVIVHQSLLSTTGLRLGLTHPGATIFAAHAAVSHTASATADGSDNRFEGPLTTSGDSVVGAGVAAATTNYVSTIEGFILPSTTGTLQVQYAAEVAASVTVKQGSHGLLFTL